MKHYGLDLYCIGVRSCKLRVLELKSKPKKEVLSIMCSIGRKLVNNSANVLTLRCASITNIKAAVKDAVSADVQVINSVLAGVQHLAGLCRLGARTAKRGMYASAAADRERRGQDW